jgi:hypothetical protein
MTSLTTTPAGQLTTRTRQCPLCQTPAGEPCSPKPEGDHLARWLDAYTAGQLTKAYMAMVLGELVGSGADVIDQSAVIPDSCTPSELPLCQVVRDGAR